MFTLLEIWFSGHRWTFLRSHSLKSRRIFWRTFWHIGSSRGGNLDKSAKKWMSWRLSVRTGTVEGGKYLMKLVPSWWADLNGFEPHVYVLYTTLCKMRNSKR